MVVGQYGITVYVLTMTSLMHKKLTRLDRASSAVAAILLKTKLGQAKEVDITALALLAQEIRDKAPTSIFSDPYLDQACNRKTTREILCLKLEAVCGCVSGNADSSEKKDLPWIEELIDTFEAISTLAQQELEDRKLLQEINERRIKQSNGPSSGEAGDG